VDTSLSGAGLAKAEVTPESGEQSKFLDGVELAEQFVAVGGDRRQIAATM